MLGDRDIQQHFGDPLDHSAVKGLRELPAKRLVDKVEPSILTDHFAAQLLDGTVLTGYPARLLYITDGYLRRNQSIGGGQLSERVFGLGYPYDHERLSGLVVETNAVLEGYAQQIVSRTSPREELPSQERNRYYRAQLVVPFLPYPVRPEQLAVLVALCTDPAVTVRTIVDRLGSSPKSGKPYPPNQAMMSIANASRNLYARVTPTEFRDRTATPEEMRAWELLRETFEDPLQAMASYPFMQGIQRRLWSLYRGEIPSFMPEAAILRREAEAQRLRDTSQEEQAESRRQKEAFMERFQAILPVSTDLQQRIMFGVFSAEGMRISPKSLAEIAYEGQVDHQGYMHAGDGITLMNWRSSLAGNVAGLNRRLKREMNIEIRNVQSGQGKHSFGRSEGSYTFVPPLANLD